MTWTCRHCAGTNSLETRTCKSCGLPRDRVASVRAYLLAGPSPFLLVGLLLLAVYARGLYVGRARAWTDLNLSHNRERQLEKDITDTRNELEQKQTELAGAKQKLADTQLRLVEVETERTELSRELRTLQQILSVQAAKLAQRPKAAAKALNVVNHCSATVRLAIRFRGGDGTWSTHSFWELQPGQHRLAVRDASGKSDEARVTWNLTYVYAEAVDGTWSYRGVDGEIERVEDRGRILTMKRWDLPVDRDDNFVLRLCR